MMQTWLVLEVRLVVQLLVFSDTPGRTHCTDVFCLCSFVIGVHLIKPSCVVASSTRPTRRLTW